MKRFNLVIPDEIYNSLEEVAQTHKTSKTAIIKKYIDLGLMVEGLDVEYIVKAADGELQKVTFQWNSI